MASINRVILVGNLGQDPELRYSEAGVPVCNLSIATNESRKNKEGNVIENVEWHRAVVFNKQAENCAKYLEKGRSVCIEGKISTRSYEVDGEKKFVTEIIVGNIQFLGGAPK